MNAQQGTRDTRRGTTLGHIEEGAAFMATIQHQSQTPDTGQPWNHSTLPSPSRLTDNAFAFQRTAALRAAVGIDVFTAIGEGHSTPAALADHCAAAERGIRVLCDFLVAIGLLELMRGRYVAAPDAAAYLDRRSPAFIGDALDFVASDTALKAVLSDPASMVRRGRTILGDFDHFGAPEQTDWSTYARAVAPMMARSARFLADLAISAAGTASRILDIAAGPGQNGIALAKRLSDARVTAIDWPNVLKVAGDNARAAGIGERWQALPGSALETEFGGPYDLALVARFLHLLAPRDREALLRRVHAALAPSGRVIVLQIVLNDDRVSPPFAAAMNFNVLATTPSGQVPTAGELEALLKQAGFDRLEWHDLPGSDERIAIGRK